MDETRIRVPKLASIAAVIMGVALGLLLLMASLADARIQAAPLRSEGTGSDPRFQAITVTSNLFIFDTHPGAGITKTVYFSNSIPGVITVTFDVSGTATLTLTAGAAFDEPERTYTSTDQVWSQAITYSVAITRTTQPHIVYSAINTDSERTTVAITYVQDITAPTMSIVSPPTGCFTGTQLVITGTAQDNDGGSGVKWVQVTTGTFWTTATVAITSWGYTWTLPVADNVVYTISARAQDFLDTASAAVTRVITVDNVAPTATVPVPDRHPWVTSTVVYDWPDSNDGAAIAGYRVSITNTEGYSVVSSTVDSVFTFTQAFTESAGYYARARAFDTNGNTGVWSGHSTVVTPDLTAASVMTPSIDTQGNGYLYAVGTTLYYTNQMDTPQSFYIEGYSLDELSGVDRVAFSPAFGESPDDDSSGFWPWGPAWPGYGVDPYTTTVGVITATVYDKAGNTEVQTYTYALDGTPPDSTAWAPDYATSSPITITWAATDTQSGVYSATLWYKKEITGAWMSSQATSASDVFAFSPPSGDGTYYFQTVAADNVTNVEDGPTGDGDDSTIYDTVAPTNVTITAPRHIPLTQFLVSWSAKDATSGVATYTVEYSGTAYTAWQEWLTGVISTEAEFHAPETETDYVFRVTAYDRAGNSGWKETRTHVGDFYIYLPLVVRNYPPRPMGSVDIENEVACVYQPSVTLSLIATVSGDTITEMRLSDDGVDWGDWESYTTTRTWPLADGLSGLRTVHVQFRGDKGGISAPVSDQIYLSLNGNFEYGDVQPGWQKAEAPLPVSIVQSAQERPSGSIPPADGSYAALLGYPDYPCNHIGVPLGYAAIEQVFSLPSNADKLTFKYIVWSQDASTDDEYDRFEVYVNGELEFSDGNQVNELGCSKWWRVPGVSNPRDEQTSGWATGEIDLSAYAGQNVTVSFRNYSRYDGWYNTYTYVDSVAVEGGW